MKEIIILICSLISPYILNSQQEIEIFPNGILPPRLTQLERDSIDPPQLGQTIYNIDAGRIESFSGFGIGNEKVWGNSATFLLDAELDSRVQFRKYIADSMIATCPPRFGIAELLSIQMDGISVIDIKKEDPISTRIEFPNNGDNILLGGHQSQADNDLSDNVIIGNKAGHPEIVSSQNILIGSSAGHQLNYPRNVMIGYEAGPQEIDDIREPIENVYLGYHCGFQRFGGRNTALGSESGANGIGRGNTFLGHEAGRYHNGNNNIAIGPEALKANGTFNFVSQFNNNIAIGINAGMENEGNDNIFIGKNAGSQENQTLINSMNNTLIINSGEAGDTPLIKGNFLTDKLMINGDIGVGIDPAEKLEINVSVKIHNLLKLTPLETQVCEEESQIGNIYLDANTMLLRVCVLSGTDYKWSELN